MASGGSALREFKSEAGLIEHTNSILPKLTSV